jgi:hypothetical protein
LTSTAHPEHAATIGEFAVLFAEMLAREWQEMGAGNRRLNAAPASPRLRPRYSGVLRRWPRRVLALIHICTRVTLDL